MSEGFPVAGSLRFMLQCNQHEIPSEGDVLQKIKTSKRDGKNHQIWTEEAILALLDAYEDKWRFLDRGSLRRKHWEEVATAVSLRGEGKWSFRTGTQCKNKIEHLKKKYRSKKASNNACATKWVFFNHMDQMLSMAYRGTTASQLAGVPELLQYGNYAEFYHKDDKLAPKSLSDDADNGKIISFGIADTKNESVPNIDMLKCCCIDSDSELKRQKTLHDQTGTQNLLSLMKSFGDSVMKFENLKIDLYRDFERLRADAEGRRVEMERTHNEMEYRRTEMMLTTQLQIAKLLTTGNRKRKCEMENHRKHAFEVAEDGYREMSNNAVSSPITRMHYEDDFIAKYDPKVAELETRLRTIEHEKDILSQQITGLIDEVACGKDRFLRLLTDFQNYKHQHI